MATRTLGIIAALGLLAPVTAHADAPGGDIVDQILKTLPPSPARAAPMTSAEVTPPAPVTPPPPSPAPASLTPANPPPGPAAATTISSTPIPPPAAPSPASNGDILVQASQTPPPIQFADTSGQWTGFYLGGNLGYGTARGGSAESCLNSVTGDSTGCDIISSPSLKAKGVLGGGQLGYLMPFSSLNLGLDASSLMIGVEADIQGSGISATQNVSGPFNFVGLPPAFGSCSPCSFAATQQISWFSTVRARVGVPVDNLFLYATGGVIFGSLKASQTLNFTGTSQGIVGSASKTNSGPVAGAGVEFMLSGPFSAKIEGLYYDLGSLKVTALPVSGAPGNFSDFKTFGFRGALIRFGINMRLGGLGGS